jgi:hypothetical protein
MYARGILFGKMKYELGDHSYVRCPEHNLVADIEFKTKGYFSGTYNAIGGTIKNEKTGEVLYELSGLWNGEMHLKDVKVRSLPPPFYWSYVLTIRVDPPQRTSIRCDTREALEAHRAPYRGTRRTRIATSMARNSQGDQHSQSRSGNGRKDQD